MNHSLIWNAPPDQAGRSTTDAVQKTILFAERPWEIWDTTSVSPELVLATWEIRSKIRTFPKKRESQKALKWHFLERISQVASTGASIHKMAHFHHVLLLALSAGVRLDGTGVLEIDLHLRQRLMQWFWVMLDGLRNREQSEPSEQPSDSTRQVG